jgi:HK97 family phage portal protein
VTKLLNLEARLHRSKALDAWAAMRPGFSERVESATALPAVQNMQVVTGVSSDAEAMKAIFAPLQSASGFPVTDKTAMLVATVFACLNKISGAITQLPIQHYRTDREGNRERVVDSPLWWLLNESPSPAWTAASWKEWIVQSIGLRGDQHTLILRGNNASGGAIRGFLPLHPLNSRARKLGDRLVYDVVHEDGSSKTYDQDDVLHFSGFGFDGLRSLSAIQTAARQAIGNSLAAADFMGRTVGEGAMPQIALQFPNKINPLQAQALRDSFVATYTGTGSRKLPLVLTEGGKAEKLGISPVDLQLLASRQFEKEDICQALGVPPIMIGDNSKTSSWGTGVEQITLGFVKFTIKPMLKRWQEEMNRKIFRNAGQFVEFDLEELLRGDSKTQADVFGSALGGPGSGDGYMTQNEIRKIKNLPPKPGGDELYKAQRGADPAAAPKKKTADPAPAEPTTEPDPAPAE